MIDGIDQPITGIMTADQLEEIHLPGKSTELLRGALLVREPPGTFHGKLSARLLLRVGTFVELHGLGEVFAQDTGFKIASSPDTVRAPDFAFVARDRLSSVGTRGYAAVSPDLVAEILSPRDGKEEVAAKVAEWLAAGVRLAWVLDPDRRTARVHRADGSSSAIATDGVLDGEAVLPGLHFPLADLFR